MKMQILPVFKDIFPEEDQPSLDDIIATIPTDAIIKCCCYINSQLYFQKNRLETEIKIFIHLIERITDDNLRNAPYKRFKVFQEKLVDHDIAIFPLPHTLKLIELAYLSKYFPYAEKTTPKQDLNILKALLILNSKANEKTIETLKDLKLDNSENIYKIFWESLLPNSTLLLQKNLIGSVYKSLIFLKFLNSNYTKYLKEYLALNRVEGYHQIPLKLFEIYTNGYKKEEDSFYSFFNKDLTEKNPLINNLFLDVPNSSREDYIAKKLDRNFKGLRTYPFLKLIKDEWHIDNWGFIVEKFYEGLVFDFFNKTSIREIKSMNSLENYKSKIGEEFTNIFFMELMKDIFGKLPIITYNEKERNQKCDYDFYIRIKNNVFLFEFKDILFPINESYEEIKKTIDTKLISNQKESPKGIGQILRHIESFNKDVNIYDDIETDGISIDKIVVHPILVYSDHAFGMTGVNHYLNLHFQEELKKIQIKCKINPLAMISIDFFMEEFSNFKNGSFDLVTMLDLFYKLLDEKKELLSKELNGGNLQGAFGGFDSTIREKIPYFSKDMVKSVFFERILEELKPYLPAK